MAFQLYIVEDELLITMKVAFNVDDAFQNCLAFILKFHFLYLDDVDVE